MLISNYGKGLFRNGGLELENEYTHDELLLLFSMIWDFQEEEGHKGSPELQLLSKTLVISCFIWIHFRVLSQGLQLLTPTLENLGK